METNREGSALKLSSRESLHDRPCIPARSMRAVMHAALQIAPSACVASYCKPKPVVPDGVRSCTVAPPPPGTSQSSIPTFTSAFAVWKFGNSLALGAWNLELSRLLDITPRMTKTRHPYG